MGKRPFLHALRIPSVLALVSALAGCGAGSGENLTENGRPQSEAGASVALAASFESIQANVFTPSCATSGCHAGAAAPLGLDLSAGVAYANLVGVAANTRVLNETVLRVNPGNPDRSLLMLKLEGDSNAGPQMPRGEQPLPTATIALIRQWIENGASPTSSTANPAAMPPVVAATVPADGDTITDFPTSVQITFSQPMDAATLTSNTIRIFRSGEDGAFDGSEETQFAVTPSDITLATDDLITVTIDLAGFNPVTDTYRLTIKGSGDAVARNTQAVVIDGDGDGVTAGDFHAEFVYDPNAILPTFNSLQATLFTPTCAKSGCHSGSSPAGGGINFEPAVAYDTLLNSGRNLIVPNEPQRSRVIQVLNSRFMPFDGGPPGFDDGPAPTPRDRFIAAITEWINKGAPETE